MGMITTMRFALDVGIFSCISEFENACSYRIMEHGCAIVWTFDGRPRLYCYGAIFEVFNFLCVLCVAIEFINHSSFVFLLL
jgi:hypothetical protein